MKNESNKYYLGKFPLRCDLDLSENMDHTTMWFNCWNAVKPIAAEKSLRNGGQGGNQSYRQARSIERRDSGNNESKSFQAPKVF